MSDVRGKFADPRRGSRHERGYGSAWVKLRATILDRDSHLCQPCRRNGRLSLANIVDHILAKEEGGSDEPSNLQSICKACHTVKTEAEAARARGATPRLSNAACASTGLPTDPRHPWNRQGGYIESSAPRAKGPDAPRRLQSGEMEGGGFGR